MTTTLATSSSNLIQVDPISGELSEFSGATLISDVNSIITTFTNTVTNQINSFMNGPTFNNATITSSAFNSGTISSASIYSPTISGATISSSVIDNITSSSSTNSINLNDSIAGGAGEMSINCSYLNLLNNNNEYTSASNFPIFMCQPDGNLLIEINDQAGPVLWTDFNGTRGVGPAVDNIFGPAAGPPALEYPLGRPTVDTSFIWRFSIAYTDYNILNSNDTTPLDILWFAKPDNEQSNPSDPYTFYDYAGSVSYDINGGVLYSTSSDYRLKENIKYIENPLERCLKLNPVNYNFINITGISEGFIAHEVQTVIPSAVSGKKDDPQRMQSLDYSKLTPLLTGAIQELHKIIENQGNDIKELYNIIQNQGNDIKELYNIIQNQNKLIEKLYN